MTTISDDMREWINEYYGINGDGHRNLTNVAGEPIDTVEFILNGMFDFPHVFKMVENKYKRLSVKKPKSWIWLTLSPDKLHRNMDVTDANIEALKNWCERWFHNNPKYYNSVSWVVECGSQGDHLHVHAICEMKSSHKHAEKLKKFWKRFFPSHELIKSGNKNGGNEYDSHSFTQEEILLDKLNYMEQEKKGSHMNLYDLGVRGSWGVLSDKI